MSPSPPVDLGDPPPIPGARSDSTGHPRRPLLVWVRTGTAHVHIDDAVAFDLTAGEGAWIPAEGWDHRAIVTEPGTVAFPLWPSAGVGAGVGAGALSEPTRFAVPDGWQDWLIQLFNFQTTPFSGRGYTPEAVGASVALTPPEMPRGVGARAVAEELIRDPALDLTVEQWAARVFTSPRTLRRDVLADTGLTFEQWRLRNRLIAAVELLTAGYDVDQVAARVGFATRNGFTRAFKQQYGLTPHAVRLELAASSARVGLTPRATAARQTDDLVRMVRGDGTFARAPDLLPATRTPSHTNDVHVLSWVYRGSGYLDVDHQRYERAQGVATWIPAGVEHITGLREDSVSLPLGSASTGDLQLTEPLQVRFSPAWDDYLMFCSVSARSGLHPPDHDPLHILDLFTEQVATQRSRSVPMPTDPRARAAAMEHLSRIGTPADAAAALDLPAEVHRAFREQTGMTFTRWRHVARMRIAGDMLAGGAPPSAVARRVGYRHLSTFSTAFSRFHGTTPRQAQPQPP